MENYCEVLTRVENLHSLLVREKHIPVFWELLTAKKNEEPFQILNTLTENSNKLSKRKRNVTSANCKSISSPETSPSFSLSAHSLSSVRFLDLHFCGLNPENFQVQAKIKIGAMTL